MTDLVTTAGPVLAALATGIPVALGVARYAFSKAGPVWGLVTEVRAGADALQGIRRSLDTAPEDLAAIRSELRAVRVALESAHTPREATSAREPITEDGPPALERRTGGYRTTQAPPEPRSVLRVPTVARRTPVRPDPLADLSRPLEPVDGDLFEQVSRRR